MVILPNMAKTVKRPLFHYFFAFFHILRCPYHGFSGHRVFLTHFWGCMRGGLWVLCAEVQKSQNASPVLKVLPPPNPPPPPPSKGAGLTLTIIHQPTENGFPPPTINHHPTINPPQKHPFFFFFQKKFCFCVVSRPFANHHAIIPRFWGIFFSPSSCHHHATGGA